MRIQKCISLALAGLALVACEKSQEQDQGKTAFKTALSQDPLDYEIYDPGVSDEYAEFKDGIVAVFNDANPGSLTAVNRAIWFYEGGLSGLLLPDDPYNDFDSLVLVSRDVNFTLDDGKIVDGDLVTEFTTDYNAILDQLNNESSYTYAGSDFRFVSIDAQELSAQVVHSYFVNASHNPWSSGTVRPATKYRTGGGNGEDCTPLGPGAYRKVRSQARAVLPHGIPARNLSFVNVVSFSGDKNTSHPVYVSQEYLFVTQHIKNGERL